MSEDGYWFRPKRYGYGAGLPLRWQGWALVAVTVAIIWLTVFLVPDRPVVILSVAIPVALICTLIAARTTRGGWRWRWGEKE